MKILLDFDDVLNLTVNWQRVHERKPVDPQAKFVRRSGWGPDAYEYHVYESGAVKLPLTVNREMLDRIAEIQKRTRAFVWLTDWLQVDVPGIVPIENMNTLPDHIQIRHEFLTSVVGSYFPIHGGSGTSHFFSSDWWKCDAVAEATKHDDIIWTDDKLAKGHQNSFAKQFDNLHMVKVVEAFGLTKPQLDHIERLLRFVNVDN